MKAQIGDELMVKGRHQGDMDRHGQIVEIHGRDGAPPYLVRWRDGHESIFFPSADTVVEESSSDHPGGY
jgi:Domain of unknown function (DUF1918)